MKRIYIGDISVKISTDDKIQISYPIECSKKIEKRDYQKFSLWSYDNVKLTAITEKSQTNLENVLKEFSTSGIIYMKKPLAKKPSSISYAITTMSIGEFIPIKK
ncbi:MAG: hypothetical protein RR144_04620 [Clostridia bacterium]